MSTPGLQFNSVVRGQEVQDFSTGPVVVGQKEIKEALVVATVGEQSLEQRIIVLGTACTRGVDL